MARSFGLSVESPASVDQVLSAFRDEGYWRARLATSGTGTATLDSLAVDEGGAVTVVVTVQLLGDRLPKMLTPFDRVELAMMRTERWTRIGGGQVQGEISVAVPGAPLSASGEALLTPLRSGSMLTYTTTVRAKIPVVGGKIEDFIGGELSRGITAIQHFTDEWIAENS